MILRKIIGERVRKARELNRLTQHELEQACGMSKTWASQIENGHRSPSVEMLVKICDVLHERADWLLGRVP